MFSYVSAFLTWNTSRLCNRAYATGEDVDGKLSGSLVKSFRRSVRIALLGMFVTLLGAEQIVGTLASKVLQLQGVQPIIGTVMTANSSLQALDIFLVQANTNILLALFAPLACYLLLEGFFSR